MGAHAPAATHAYACAQICVCYLSVCQTGCEKSWKRAKRAAAAHQLTQHSTDWAAIQTSLGNSNPQQPHFTLPSLETQIHCPAKGEENELADRVPDSEKEAVTLATLLLLKCSTTPLFKVQEVNYSTSVWV